MKRTRQANSNTRGLNAFPVTRLYSCAAFILLIGFMVVSTALTDAARHPVASGNPFSSFVDIFPGHLKDEVEARGFACRSNSSVFPSDETCNLFPEWGVFAQVGVVITANRVRHVSFLARENALRLGDLAIIYGAPTMRQFGSEVYFMWLDGSVMALCHADADENSFFLPVWSVSFHDTSVPV